MEEFESLLKEVGAYIWYIVVAVIGSSVSYLGQIRSGDKEFSLIEMIGEWFTSGFVGLITAYAGVALDLSFPLIAALCGITGHMGGRAIYMAEGAVKNFVESKTRK